MRMIFIETMWGENFKIYEIEGDLSDPRIVLSARRRYRFKAERFRKCGIGVELDDNLFQL